MRRAITLLSLLAVFIGLTIWMTSIGRAGIFAMASPQRLLSATATHLQIVWTAELLAIAIGLPIGFLLTRRRIPVLTRLLEGVTNMGQTLPTLVFIALFSAILGFGRQSAVVAIATYTLLPIVRNTYAGIKAVDPAIRDAARGMGMSYWQIVGKVELPLAVPVIMAGIRTSTVINVGTAAVAGMIGAGGLGAIITEGIAVNRIEIVLQGAAPTAGLAVILDAILGTFERGLTPKGIKSSETAAVT